MEDAIRGDGSACGGRKYILAVALFFLLYQNSYRIRSNGDGAVGIFRFQGRLYDLAVDPRHLAADADNQLLLLGKSQRGGYDLASKRMVADYYSKLMAGYVKSTVRIDDNYDAIQNHVNGMSITKGKAGLPPKYTFLNSKFPRLATSFFAQNGAFLA